MSGTDEDMAETAEEKELRDPVRLLRRQLLLRRRPAKECGGNVRTTPQRRENASKRGGGCGAVAVAVAVAVLWWCCMRTISCTTGHGLVHVLLRLVHGLVHDVVSISEEVGV